MSLEASQDLICYATREQEMEGEEKNTHTNKETFGYISEMVMIATMHGPISYRFPTAVREILKGLLDKECWP